MPDDPPADAPPGDLLFVYGKTDDTYSVVRRRGETVEVGAIRELEEGKPIHGELVKLARRKEHPLLFSVETVDLGAGAVRGGPPQVATRAYRDGWDAIFRDDDEGIDEKTLN